MKKALLVMLSVLLAVSAVFAGGAKEGSSDGSLRFMWWGGDARNAATVDVINKYMEENPEISIAAEINSDSGYVDKVAVMLASGTAPDIMQPEFYFNNYEISMLKSLSTASFSGQSRSFAR